MTPKWDSAESSTREDFRLIDADTGKRYKKLGVWERQHTVKIATSEEDERRHLVTKWDAVQTHQGARDRLCLPLLNTYISSASSRHARLTARLFSTCIPPLTCYYTGCFPTRNMLYWADSGCDSPAIFYCHTTLLRSIGPLALRNLHDSRAPVGTRSSFKVAAHTQTAITTLPILMPL